MTPFIFFVLDIEFIQVLYMYLFTNAIYCILLLTVIVRLSFGWLSLLSYYKDRQNSIIPSTQYIVVRCSRTAAPGVNYLGQYLIF